MLSAIRHSIRLRLVIWHTGVLALVLLAFGLALIVTVRGSLNSSIDADLRRRNDFWVEIFSREPVRLNTKPRPPRRESERSGFFRRPRVLGADGQPLFGASEDVAWDPEAFLIALHAQQSIFTETVVEGEPVRVFSAPFGQPDAFTAEGVVQTAYSLVESRRLIRDLTNVLLMLLPVALVVAGLGGLFLTSRALQPVADITAAAAQIGVEDLSRRLPVRTEDELGALARTFNGMIGRLEEAFARLDAAYREQRRFIDDASHELRTPLTSIKANTSLSLLGEPDLQEYAECLRAVDRSADVMQRIVDDLLLLARSDSGRLQMRQQPVDVNELLLRAVSGAGCDQDRRVNVLLSAEPVVTLGDAHHLERLLVNLLSNSLRHTGEQGRITVEAERRGSDILIKVRDTGEGIPEEHLPHLFERFYRVDTARTRSTGGFGLGLPICRSIAEGHGGSIELKSEQGQGTEVTVVLPASEPASRREPAPASRA